MRLTPSQVSPEPNANHERRDAAMPRDPPDRLNALLATQLTGFGGALALINCVRNCVASCLMTVQLSRGKSRPFSAGFYQLERYANGPLFRECANDMSRPS